MSGALWATIAGVGFGLFQTVNRRAMRGMDVWQSTFLQLAISSVVLVIATLATEDLAAAWSAEPDALAFFVAAGLLHFFAGWTLLNASQKRIGAARTGPLTATTPLFGTLLAALTLGEVPGAGTVAGIALTMAGVLLTTADPAPAPAPRGRELVPLRQAGAAPAPWPTGAGATAGPAGAAEAGPAAWPEEPRGGALGAWLFGLGTAACWAASPLLIREGLRDLPSPLLGVTFGVIGATVPQGIVLLVRGRSGLSVPISWEERFMKLAAGVLVGLSTWTRWVAVALAPVAVVLSLGLLAVPTVLLLAPLLSGRTEEPVTARVWLGAALVVGGSLLLLLRP